MSEVRTIDEITLVDFEGIENITKFKYRTTLPKYPKPGTFYWIEQDVNGQPKLGLYFVTNKCELVRLDSKLYDLVVEVSDDSYLQITDKDEFDTQYIYLIIGNFEKEDEIEDDGTEKGKRVFKITKKENKGLATVEAVVEYVSDSNNVLYQSNVEDFWWVGKRLGDIREGQTKEDLKNNTISEILDTIIYPTLQPTHTEPSVTLSSGLLGGLATNKSEVIEDGHLLISIEKLMNTTIEDGDESESESEEESETIEEPTTLETILERINDEEELLKYISYYRGELTYPTEEPDEDGNIYVLNNYTGRVSRRFDTGNIGVSFGDTPKNITDLENNLDSRYNFSVSLYFEDGPTPLDNKRQPARYDNLIDTCTCENGCEKCYIPPFVGQWVKSNTLTVDVVYPFYVNYVSDTNNSIKNIMQHPLVNYHEDGGGVAYVEIPREVDGFNAEQPCKFCIDVPQHLDVKVYQYNELCHTYDVLVDMDWIYTEVRFNTLYNRLIRTKDKYNTNIESVKYKIVFNKR